MQIKFIITEFNLRDNLIYESLPITLYSVRELKDHIINIFCNHKTYLTKERDSNESIIKCITDETKILHLREYN